METQKIIIPENCTGITLQFEFAESKTPKFKAGDIWFNMGVYHLLHETEDEIFTNSFGFTQIEFVEKHYHDGWRLASKEEFQSELAKVGKIFNFETSKLEDLDEFDHLPKTWEECWNKLPSPKGNFISMSQCSNNQLVFPHKYAEAILVQPKLLQLYEAWKDDRFNPRDGNSHAVVYVNGFCVAMYSEREMLFQFRTRKKAERFLELFRTELELYKPLMRGN